MQQLDRSQYQLSTGKTFYANNGILGIDPELNVYEGYDGRILEQDYPEVSDLTTDEMIEVAEFAITQWQTLRDELRAVRGDKQ